MTALMFGSMDGPPQMHDETGRVARAVRAGQVTAVLDGLSLRGITYGDVLLVKGLRPTVRDAAWGTATETLSEVTRCEIGSDRFLIEHNTRHEGADGLDLTWSGSIEGAEQGVIEVEMQAVAQAAFSYGRIGFDLLHPLSFVGCSYVARAEDGSDIVGVFPSDVAPQPFVDGVFYGMFDPFTELRVQAAPGLTVVAVFDGEPVEMEDQRNWTDASFKTYPTPLARGLSHQAQAGQEFFRRVRIWVEDDRAGEARRAPRTTLGEPPPVSDPVHLPALGTQLTGQESPVELQLLRELRLDHIRIDLDTTTDDWATRWAALEEILSTLDAPVELVLTVREHAPDLMPLASARVGRLLVLGAGRMSTPRGYVESTRAALRRCGLPAPVGGGTEFFFAELNQVRPHAAAMDFVAFPVTPQVHAFDDASVLETTAIQTDVVQTARSFCEGRPIAITPLTLRPRTGQPPGSGGAWAADVDPRQSTTFCAAWTLASVVNLAAAGAASATYFEASGARGLMLKARRTPTFVLLRELTATRKAAARLVGAGVTGVTGLIREEDAVRVAWITNTAAEPRKFNFPWAARAALLVDGPDEYPEPWQATELGVLHEIHPGCVLRIEGVLQNEGTE